MTHLKKIPFPIILPGVLVLTAITCILATDLYVPSLPHISEFFETSDHTVQLTMSLNLLGFALAQVIYGPISDAWGRRPIVLFGAILFLTASLICALSPNIETLIFARLLQGVGAGSIAVLGIVIIREAYGTEQQTVRLISILSMVIALAPAVGPVIGGYIYEWLGWRANFYFLSGLGFLSVISLYFFMQETLVQPDPRAWYPRQIIRNYKTVLTNKAFICYTLILGCIFAGLFTFITQAPFILIGELKLQATTYGLYQGGIVFAYIIGNMVSRALIGRYGLDQLMKWSISGIVLGALGLAFIAFNPALLTPVTLCVPMAIYASNLGIVFSTAATRALSIFPEIRGSASAALGAIEMGLAGFAVVIASQTYDHTARSMAFVILSLSLITFFTFVYLRRHKLHQPLPKD